MNSKYFGKETLKKILRSKKKIEDKAKVKINIKNSEVSLEGNEVNIYATEKVLEAMEKNFPVELALLLLEPEYILESLSIKDITRKKTFERIRSRVIGQYGRTLQLLSELSDCHITLTNNIINIIGTSEKIKEATNAVKSLVQGSKQANVYSYLEKSRTKIKPEGLGLKYQKEKE